jgi:hypothetical protein
MSATTRQMNQYTTDPRHTVLTLESVIISMVSKAFSMSIADETGVLDLRLTKSYPQ